MIRRGRFKNRYQGHTLWFATHEPQEANNAMTYSGLGKWGLYDPNDQGVEDSGVTSRPASGVATNFAHSGSRAMRVQINTSVGTSGCRTFMSQFTSPGGSMYHTAWFYFPSQLTASGHQIMQIKNKPAVGSSDVAWKLAVKNPAAGRMQLNLVYELGTGFGALGPHAGEDNTGAAKFYPAEIDFPDSQWVKVQMYVKQSVFYNGRVMVWQGQRKIFDLTGVNTKTAGSTNTWSVNNYGSGTSPATFTLYIDDCSVGTRKL